MTINEQAILGLFSELLIGEVFEKIFHEDFSESETTAICSDLLIPATIQLFASKYHSVERADDEDDLNPCWETFCHFQKVPNELQNLISLQINSMTQELYERENRDDAGVTTQTDWKDLPVKDRIQKVKMFLAALANAHNDIKTLKPFIKSLPSHQDSYGNDFGEKVKVRSNRYGPAEAIDESFPTRQHFREVAKTVAAVEDPKKRQELATHHASIFSKMNPRFDHQKWHEACNTKAGKTTIKEGNALHNLPIKESLFDSQSAKRVKAYAAWLDRNASALRNDDNSRNQRDDLAEAAKLKAEHDQKFANGEAEYDPSDYIFGRTRTAKPKGRK